MAPSKIPVTVTPALKKRVEVLVDVVKSKVSPTARTAITNSAVCRAAIEDLLGRYEKNPENLASRMGFALNEEA